MDSGYLKWILFILTFMILSNVILAEYVINVGSVATPTPEEFNKSFTDVSVVNLTSTDYTQSDSFIDKLKFYTTFSISTEYLGYFTPIFNTVLIILLLIIVYIMLHPFK